MKPLRDRDGALRRRHERWRRRGLEELVLLWRAARGVQSRNVVPHLGFHFKVFQRFAEDAGGGLVLGHYEAIVHPLALASRRNDSRAAKVGKMARNLRLADAKDFDEITDANLPVRNQVQQTKARRIR